MSKTKKLDIFNLFYSGAAVVILIGVIAKLLEWPAQDLLITGGLAIEAVVFGVSAIKFVEVKKDDQVATEATLSKVADGLGNITGNSTGVGGSGFSSNYDYIQTDKIMIRLFHFLKMIVETIEVIIIRKATVGKINI